MDRRQKRYSFSNFDQCSYQVPKHQSKAKDYTDYNEYPQNRSRFYKPESPSPIDHRNSFIQLPSFGDCHAPTSFEKKQQYRCDQFQYRSREMNQLERKRNRAQTTTDQQPRHNHIRRQSIQSQSAFSKSWNKPISGDVRNQKLKEISDLRVVNIDKINMKIKNILDKLNQEENRNNIFAQKVQSYHNDRYHSKQNKHPENRKFTNFDSFKFNHNLYGDSDQFIPKNQLEELTPTQNHHFNNKTKIDYKERQYNNDSYLYQRDGHKKYAHTPSKPKLKQDCITKNYTEIDSPYSQFTANNYEFDKYRNKYQKPQYSKSLKATFNPHNYNVSLPMKNNQNNIESEKWNINHSINSDNLSNKMRYTGQKRSQIWSSDKNRLEENYKEKITNRSFVFNRGEESAENNITKSSLFDRTSNNNSRQHSLILKNGKNLDNEIQRIQEKMDMLQKIKKDLNLKEENIQQINQQKPKVSTPFQMNQHLFKEKKEEIRVLNQSNLSQNKRQLKELSNKMNVNSRAKQNQSKKNEQVTVPKPFQMAKNKQTKRLDSLDTSQNHRLTSQKIIESQRQSQQFIIPKHIPLPQSSDLPRCSVSLKKMISILNSQIELDSQFRNAKKWFENVSSFYKWKELKQQLTQSIDQQFNQQQIKDVFTLQEDQNNPFHSVRQSDGTIKLLIQAFIKAEEHWQKYLQGQFIKQHLIQQGFTEKNIDLDRKGTITVQDFLRFINFQANTFYRIRDVTLVFKRITSSYEVDFDSLIQTFCKPSDTQEIYSLSSKRSNFMLL